MKHKHRWQFSSFYKDEKATNSKTLLFSWYNLAQFICECGETKIVKLKKEVKR